MNISIFAQNQLTIPPAITGGIYNLNLAPDSVQFVTGAKTESYGYNGSYLGPTLILQKGATANLFVTNNLPDTTTTHWHGMHISADNDGGPHTLILPGDTWNPSFTVLDKAATYWYHPHLHGRTGEHVMKGAAGLIIVQDTEEAALALPRTYGVDDFPLIVQTQQFDASNQVFVDGMNDSITVVNGTIDPYVEMPAQVVRMRILNADQERNYKFGFTNDQAFSVIGSDGGLLAAPVNLTRVDAAPGERTELLLDLSGMNGQTIYLMSYGSEIPMRVQGGPSMMMPGTGMPMPMMNSPLNGKNYNVLQINVVAATTSPTPITTIPSTLVSVTPINPATVNNSRVIKFTPKDNPTAMEAMDGPFFFNDSTFNMSRIDQTVSLNDVEIWTLINRTMVAHPFHIHDVQFFILDINGLAPSAEKAGRKDVVSVGSMDTVRFIAKFEDFSGTTPYMYHCHNLMHEDGGMMGQFVVTNNTGIETIYNDKIDITVYPNPTKHSVSIQLNNSTVKMNTILLYDVLGRKQLELLNLNSSNSVDLDLSKLSKGHYFSVIYTDQGTITKKIIKD